MTPPVKYPALHWIVHTVIRYAESLTRSTAGPVAGYMLLVLVWQILALSNTTIPSPEATFRTALGLFMPSEPVAPSNSTGLGWNIVVTLKRLMYGLALAITIGFPIGVLLGRLTWLSALFTPAINLFRHVSPLAWLPFGLLVFHTPESAAVWTIFVCSLWPVLNQTAEGIRRVPKEYHNLARTLAMTEWTTFTRIMLPAAAPNIVTGLRMAVSGAWLVVIASEMFIGGEGIGSWLRMALTNANGEKIVIAIVLVGTMGLLLDLPLLALRKRFTPKN